MPRRELPWFRFYTEAVYDRKLRRLPVAERWVWVVILALARQSPIPGFLMLSEREPLLEDDIAEAAVVPGKVVRSALESFEKLGMTRTCLDLGCIEVTNWSERQFESDTSTERVRAFRQRSRNGHSNGDATFHETPMQRFSNGRRNAPDTETDTETEKNPLLTSPSEKTSATRRRQPRRI